MNHSEIAKLALKTFAEVQVERIHGVLVEAIEAPGRGDDDWRVTIGYTPYQELLGVPVSGPRLRSVLRFQDDGAFVGMYLHKSSA